MNWYACSFRASSGWLSRKNTTGKGATLGDHNSTCVEPAKWSWLRANFGTSPTRAMDPLMDSGRLETGQRYHDRQCSMREQTFFSPLVSSAHSGEVIVVAKTGQPWARLVPLLESRDGGTLIQLAGAIIDGVGIFLPGILFIFFVHHIWGQLKAIRAVQLTISSTNAVPGTLIAVSIVDRGLSMELAVFKVGDPDRHHCSTLFHKSSPVGRRACRPRNARRDTSGRTPPSSVPYSPPGAHSSVPSAPYSPPGTHSSVPRVPPSPPGAPRCPPSRVCHSAAKYRITE